MVLRGLLLILILDLAAALFVREHVGLLLLVPPETGKSRSSYGSCRGSYPGRSHAIYRSAFSLAKNMAEVEGTGTRKKLINNLCKVDLPVLGDLGMKRLPPTATEAFTGSLRASLRKWGDHLDYQSASGGLGGQRRQKNNCSLKRT